MIKTAFSNRNLSLYLTGRFISSLGNSFLFFAQSIMAYIFTEGLTGVGLLWIVRGISSLLLIPFGGTIADKFNKKIIILSTDFISGIISLSFIFVSKENYMWLLPLLVFTSQAINRFFDPAARAAFKDVALPTPLEVAGATSAILGQISTILGPLVASMVYFLSHNLSSMFVIDSISFLISFIFMLLVSFGHNEKREEKKNTFFVDMFGGFRYIIENKSLLYIIMSMIPIAFCGKVFEVLILQVSESKWGFKEVGGIGIYLALFSLGGIIASSQVKRWNKFINNVNSYYLFSAFSGVFFIILGLSFNVYSSMLVTFILGMLLNLSIVMAQINIQKNVSENLLGRVFSAWTFLAVIGGGIGAYGAGIIADNFGTTLALVIIGLSVCLFTLLFVGISLKTNKITEKEESL
ncbi:TPA: MFS transporter [Bacillus pseudomycoides]|nr:MFS transporter [Bacillus pseudomycoides]